MGGCQSSRGQFSLEIKNVCAFVAKFSASLWSKILKLIPWHKTAGGVPNQKSIGRALA